MPRARWLTLHPDTPIDGSNWQFALTCREEVSMGRGHCRVTIINVLSADVLVALPGDSGTETEIELAARYGRPCVAFLPDRVQGGSITLNHSGC